LEEHATGSDAYTERLLHLQTARWKKLLHVQAPYGWNLRRLRPGFTLEIGCGIGRNLLHLGGAAVGTDTNPQSVEVCRRLGLTAFTPTEFAVSGYATPGRFDSILLSHVAEHMTRAELVALLRDHLPFLMQRGRLILIAPQEVGYRSDPTHVEFMDFEQLEGVLSELGFERERAFSFPFPRWAGNAFVYNEFVVVGSRRA
jgi:SAM-dependent methyltransferase